MFPRARSLRSPSCRLKLDLDSTEQEKLRYTADADRVRAAGDEAAAQVSMLEVKVLDQQAKKLQADIDSATLRSPIDGVVMTRTSSCAPGSFSRRERPSPRSRTSPHGNCTRRSMSAISPPLAAFQEKGPLDLTYILYSQSAHVLHSRITSRQQISSSAYPKDKDNVFVITVDNPPIPPDVLKDIRPGLTGRAELELGRQPLLVSLAKRFYRWFQFRMVG